MDKIAFLFPGQGSQYVGMGKSLYEQFPIVQQTFEEASDRLGLKLADVCFHSSLANLSKHENAFIALLTTSVAAFRVYMKEIGITPRFCAGHSLGEYSALVCSGAVNFGDALEIVYQRGKLAQEIIAQGNSAMTIIDGIGKEVIGALCRKISRPNHAVSVACFNSFNQVAVSGDVLALKELELKVPEAGGQFTRLFRNAPFHCPLMDPAAEQLSRILQKFTFRNPRYPVLSNVTALPYHSVAGIIENLTVHIIRPVQWEAIMAYLQKYGVTLTVELGAKNVLSNLIKANTKNITPYCFDQKEDRQSLIQLFTSDHQYQKHVPTVISLALMAAAATPNINWNPAEYQTGVIEPYQKLQQMQNQLEKEGLGPTVAQMNEALTLLRLIFTTKKLSVAEQTEWFQQIIEETGSRDQLPDFECTEKLVG